MATTERGSQDGIAQGSPTVYSGGRSTGPGDDRGRRGSVVESNHVGHHTCVEPCHDGGKARRNPDYSPRRKGVHGDVQELCAGQELRCKTDSTKRHLSKFRNSQQMTATAYLRALCVSVVKSPATSPRRAVSIRGADPVSRCCQSLHLVPELRLGNAYPRSSASTRD